MGEEIKPKYAPARIIELKPLWTEIDGDALRRDGLGKYIFIYIYI